MIRTAENTIKKFNQGLLDKYPKEFAGLKVHQTHEFYNLVLRAQLTWNNTGIANVTERLKRSIPVSNEGRRMYKYFKY